MSVHPYVCSFADIILHTGIKIKLLAHLVEVEQFTPGSQLQLAALGRTYGVRIDIWTLEASSNDGGDNHPLILHH